MTLAILAKLVAQDTPQAVLTITGATGGIPTGSPKYTSDFSTGPSVDGWSGGSDGAPAAPTCSTVPIGMLTYALYVSPLTDPLQYAKRTVTGLTSGHFYRITGRVKCATGTVVAYLQVAGKVAGTLHTAPSAGYATLTYEFTASASSHDVQLRRTAGAANALFLLDGCTVQELTSLGTGAVTVQRTDRNGSHYVRQTSGAAPDTSGNITIIDEEFALDPGGGDVGVLYIVRDNAGNLASVGLVNYDNTGTFTWLANVLEPVGYLDQRATIARVDTYDAQYTYSEDSTTTITVLGRADPISVSRVDDAWSLRAGQLVLWAGSYSDALTIVAAYQVGRVSLLRFCAFEPSDLYHVANTVKINHVTQHEAGWEWSVTVDYLEVGWPAGDLQGLTGWGYDDVLATYLAYYNLTIPFATYADLLAGP